MNCWRAFIPAVLAAVAACSDSSEAPPAAEVAVPVAAGDATFVGSTACAECHEAEYTDWQGSHHQLAMQDATPETILADFDDASVEYFGATSRMFRDGERYVMQTDNKDGELEEFEVSHVFGITPLQQYLTEFPDGRKQILPFAWDARAETEGGQRWYHMYPDEEILHDDVLHWTARYFNWNYMCAECHSTDLQVNYDLESNTFDTTWSEISVGCEACHGPGSSHIAQAGTAFDDMHGFPVDLDDHNGAAWLMNLETGISERSTPITSHQQPESCGRCHSRRAVIADPYEYGKPLLDTHRLSLLEDHLYHADGRILEEVYVYGSFVQSKMYAAGVTCTDCHDPHSGQLVTGPNPNDVCSQCHLPTKFATTDHAPNNDCVSCHMQDEVYMGVDPRRDHSFRLPDTATDPNHYGVAIAAAREGNVDLRAAIDPELPAIVRATLITHIAAPFSGAARAVLEHAAADSEPLIRMAALDAIQAAPPDLRPDFGAALLDDPVRAVRIQAAFTYVELRDLLPYQAARNYPAAAEEFRATQLSTASTPESLAILAEFEYRSGNAELSNDYLRKAINIDPRLAVARHSYGLALVRAGDYDGALEQLRVAYELEPENSRFAYVYAVALNSAGLREEALEVLNAAIEHNPEDRDLLSFQAILTAQQ